MLSEKPWNLFATVRLFAMVVATFCMGMITANVIELLHLGPERQRHFIEMVIVGLSFQAGALVWIGIYVQEAGTTINDAFGISIATTKAIGLGLAVGFLFIPFAWVLQEGCSELMKLVHLNPNPQPVVDELTKEGLTIAEKIFFGVLSVVIAPVAEESFFRGIIYPTVKQAGYPRLALWGTAVLFAVSHMNMVSFVPLLLFGLILSLLYEKTNNLLTNIFAHSIFNAVNFFLLIFQDQVTRWLK